MDRRQFLATTGSSVSFLVTGCSSTDVNASRNSPSETATPTETGTSSETATSTPTQIRRVPIGQTATVGDVPLTVNNPRVSKAVFAQGVHDPALRTIAGQYVTVDVTINGRPRDDLVTDTLRPAVGSTVLTDMIPVPTITEGEFAVPFPAEEHDTAAIRWQHEKTQVSWILPATVRESLALEPKFRIETFALPRRDGQLVLELTVANEGERDGQFKAEVSIKGYSGNAVIEFPVPAGESRSYRGRPGKILLYFEDGLGETITVQYPGDDSVSRLEHTREMTDTPTESRN